MTTKEPPHATSAPIPAPAAALLSLSEAPREQASNQEDLVARILAAVQASDALQEAETQFLETADWAPVTQQLTSDVQKILARTPEMLSAAASVDAAIDALLPKFNLPSHSAKYHALLNQLGLDDTVFKTLDRLIDEALHDLASEPASPGPKESQHSTSPELGGTENGESLV